MTPALIQTLLFNFLLNLYLINCNVRGQNPAKHRAFPAQKLVGIRRFRPLSSSPLPYTVFAPTLFEFDPIKSSSPLD